MVLWRGCGCEVLGVANAIYLGNSHSGGALRRLNAFIGRKATYVVVRVRVDVACKAEENHHTTPFSFASTTQPRQISIAVFTGSIWKRKIIPKRRSIDAR
jgi:hypothetical protein